MNFKLYGSQQTSVQMFLKLYRYFFNQVLYSTKSNLLRWLNTNADVKTCSEGLLSKEPPKPSKAEPKS